MKIHFLHRAFLFSRDQPVRKTHDLVDLVRLCAVIEPSFEELRDDAVLLNPYYTDTRYPTTWAVGLLQKEAYAALEAVERIREFMLNKLSKHENS